ncbi:uncharacterized protein BXZ73DRAFT_58985 [Epithele typhae]|uniref:uncharacterized protein n=1 Tax=Epithele typhae TaxID=378194 RepID=UPI002007DDA6|nr:uncharacterized protein BXZ73DRAFT_58985 [Epithele typhae]KAH9910216.1 hypothetical protein BXZ73DRAFT_58985 [Epithele typhae]
MPASVSHRTPSPPRPPQPALYQNLPYATREEVSQLAMSASITGNPFEDVKFYVFSRRSATGRVDTPLPLYANSALIRKVSSHFDYVLAGGFGESVVTTWDDMFPEDRPSFTEEYDYTSDSDLEDFPSDELDSSADSQDGTVAQGEAQPGVLGSPTEAEEVEEKHQADVKGKAVGNTISSFTGRKGRVVFIQDIAYRTWLAFVFYAYFGKASFAPLKSQNQAVDTPKTPLEPPQCSPKSMYRIAEKYNATDLRRLAIESIKSRLSMDNILVELFSSFTLFHPEILAFEVEYLSEHLTNPEIVSQLPQWLRLMESGDLPMGAADAFAAVVKGLPPKPAAPITPICRRCPYSRPMRYYCNGCGSYSG